MRRNAPTNVVGAFFYDATKTRGQKLTFAPTNQLRGNEGP